MAQSEGTAQMHHTLFTCAACGKPVEIRLDTLIEMGKVQGNKGQADVTVIGAHVNHSCGPHAIQTPRVQ